jgi:hypothetical protein
VIIVGTNKSNPSYLYNILGGDNNDITPKLTPTSSTNQREKSCNSKRSQRRSHNVGSPPDKMTAFKIDAVRGTLNGTYQLDAKNQVVQGLAGYGLQRIVV